MLSSSVLAANNCALSFFLIIHVFLLTSLLPFWRHGELSLSSLKTWYIHSNWIETTQNCYMVQNPYMLAHSPQGIELECKDDIWNVNIRQKHVLLAFLQCGAHPKYLLLAVNQLLMAENANRLRKKRYDPRSHTSNVLTYATHHV